MFSAEEQLGLVQEETLVVFHTRSTHAYHGRPRGQRGMKWRDARNSLTWSKHTLQYRKWRNRLTWKAWTVQRPVLRLKPKIPDLLRTRWKRSSCDSRHHPVCRGYKSWNRCIHGYRCLFRHADGNEKPSARSRRRYSRISCCSERNKKLSRLRISRLRSNELYSTESWRIGIERFGGTHLKFSGCTWYKLNSGKKKANLQALSKKVNLMSEILAGPVLTNNHLRKPHDKQVVPATWRGIWREKYASSKPKATTCHSLLKAPETQKIVCLLRIRELQCTMLSNGESSSDTMDTLRRSKTHMRLTATECSANKRVSTSFWSWSRSVRNSAITRWNASDSTASSALLKTRIFIWVENGETPQLAKNGKTITCTTDNLVLLVVSRLSSWSSSSLSSTSGSTDQTNDSTKLGRLLDPVTTWSGKHACGKPMLIDHDKQVTGNQQTRRLKKIQRKAFLFGYSPSLSVYRTWRHMCPHIPLKERTQIRKEMLQKWRHKNGSIVFILTSPKTERDLFCEQKSMVTW